MDIGVAHGCRLCLRYRDLRSIPKHDAFLRVHRSPVHHGFGKWRSIHRAKEETIG